MISEDSVIARLLDWSWLIILGAFGLLTWVFKWLFGHINNANDVANQLASFDKRIALLEQHWVIIETKLVEFDTRRREDRQEIVSKIDQHHLRIYEKLDKLAERLPKQP